MNPRKVTVLGNPLPTPPSDQIHSGEKNNRIAYIGRFSGPKGERLVELLENTFPQLLTNSGALQIDLIGGNLKQNPNLQSAFEKIQNLFPNRVHFVGKIENLRVHYKNYDLILGSGRVAVEALQRETLCYALGEYSAEGVITTANYSEAKKSNFGDIGAKQISIPFNGTKVADEIRQALANKEPALALRLLVEQDFSQTQICREIFDLYQSSYFRRLHPHPIPVLMYHKIPTQEQNSKHRIFVTRDNFEKHLQFFKKKNFTTLSFAELDQFRTLQRPLHEFPKKPLILTFDDGYVDNLENAGPLLKAYKMKATIFLLADSNLRTNSWDADTGDPPETLMSLEQKKSLPNFNFEIGSHGFRHQKITQMTEDQALAELKDSKEKLEKDLGVSIPVFAFTYGITSPKAAELAKKAGYRFAVNTDTGGLHMEENPFSIFRTSIFPEDSTTQLRKKTSTWYRSYFHWKRHK